MVSRPLRERPADERAGDDDRRLPHLHVEGSAPDRARGPSASRRWLPDPTARGSRWSIGGRSGSTAPTASGRRSRTPTSTSPRSSPPARIVYAGTVDARVLQLSAAGTLDALPSFDTVARARLVAPGGFAAPGAVDDRDQRRAARCSSTCTSAGSRVRPTAVAPGYRPSTSTTTSTRCSRILRSRDRRRRRVGGLLPQHRRRRDVVQHDRRHGADVRARGVAFIGDDVLVTVSDGPSRRAPRVPRCPSTAARSPASPAASPNGSHGNVDTRCIASDGRKVALVDGAGNVWRRPTEHRRLAARSPRACGA